MIKMREDNKKMERIKRTVKEYYHTLKVFDEEKDSVEMVDVVTYGPAVRTMKEIKRNLKANQTLLKVVETKIIEKRYSLLLSDFLRMAEPITGDNDEELEEN